MIRLTVVHSFSRQPRCPACQQNLVNGCWAPWRSIALCHACHQMAHNLSPTSTASPPALVLRDLHAFHRSGDIGHSWTLSCGIHFYTPLESATRNCAAHLDPYLGGRPDKGSPDLRPGDDLPPFISPPVLGPSPSNPPPEVPD